MYADVAGFEIRLEFARARPGLVELRVRDAYRAVGLGGTSPVDARQDVRLAADVAEILPHARAEPHPTVASRRHDDDAAVSAARRELIRLAVVAAL